LIHNVHALELNLIFLRSEVIGAEGNLLVWNFSQLVVLVVLVVGGWLLKVYFVKTIK
jgi:hypothetical protein